MSEQNAENGLPRQATLAECLAMSQKHDRQLRSESAFIEAQQAKAAADAQAALVKMREESAAALAEASSKASTASLGGSGTGGAEPTEASGEQSGEGAGGGDSQPAGVDWKPYSDEQLVGMAAAAGIEKSVHEGNREMIILALEEKGFKPQE